MKGLLAVAQAEQGTLKLGCTRLLLTTPPARISIQRPRMLEGQTAPLVPSRSEFARLRILQMAIVGLRRQAHDAVGHFVTAGSRHSGPPPP
jgi:N-acyl-L-homoserine lactone synthetase